MYVWRLPLIHFVALIAFVAVALTWEVVAWLRRRFRGELAGGLALGCGALVAVFSPGIVHLVVETSCASSHRSRRITPRWRRASCTGGWTCRTRLTALERPGVRMCVLRALVVALALYAIAMGVLLGMKKG
jgi:hypothetical protein